MCAAKTPRELKATVKEIEADTGLQGNGGPNPLEWLLGGASASGKDRSCGAPALGSISSSKAKRTCENPGVYVVEKLREGAPDTTRLVFGEPADAGQWSAGFADWMIVFPLKAKSNLDTELKETGQGSAEWYLNQIIVDDAIFTAEPKKLWDHDMFDAEHGWKDHAQNVFIGEHAEGHGFPAAPSSGVGRTGSNSEGAGISRQSNKSTTSLLRNRTDSEGLLETIGMWGKSSQHKAGEDVEGIAVDPDMVEAYERAKQAKNFEQLKECVCELILRFLVCRYCGFQARAFLSIDADELFVAISATDEMLRAHADNLEYQLQVDPELSIKLLKGNFDVSEISPPFIRFDNEAERRFKGKNGRSAFRKYCDVREDGSMFRGVDRIRIIKAVMDKTFSFGVMEGLGFVSMIYPMHHQAALRPLATEWVWQHFCSFEVPAHGIRDYYGENLGFRMIHLRFQTRFIAPLAFASPILCVLNQFPCRSSVMMLTSFTMMLWAAAYMECWKRTEALWRMRWGMEDFHASEKVRPEFQGDWRRDPVDRYTLVKSDKNLSFRRTITIGITVFFIMLVVCTTTLLYYFEAELAAQGHKRATTWVLVCIALQMRAYTGLWWYLAPMLTDYDNWKTDTEYFDALVMRVFSFQFINSFYALFYIALVKHLRSDCADANECSADLALQLRILFGINMIFHIISMAMPYITFKVNIWLEGRDMEKKMVSSGYAYAEIVETRPFIEEDGVSENFKDPRPPGQRRPPLVKPSRGFDSQDFGSYSSPERRHSYQEAQAKLPVYDLPTEVWERLDVTVELGYVLFFGFVAPDIIVLFFISNILRLRALGWIYSYAGRRPFPRGGTGIGSVFHKVYKFICRVAVSANLTMMLVYCAQGSREQDIFIWLKTTLSRPTKEGERQFDWKSMLVVLLVLDRAIVLLQETIDTVINDVPPKVIMERRRRQLILDRLHNHMFDIKSGQEVTRAYRWLPPRIKEVQGLVAHRDSTKSERWAPVDVLDLARGESIRSWETRDSWFQRDWSLEEDARNE